MPLKIYTKTAGDEGYIIELERLPDNKLLRVRVKGGEEIMSKAKALELIEALTREADQMN